MGHRDRALRYFQEAQHFIGANPSYMLIVDGRRAMVEDDPGAFPELWRRASLWNDRQIEDRVLVSWVTCLRNHRMLAQGLRASEGHPGPWTDPQRALIPRDLGRVAEAEAVLGDAPPKTRFMEERFYWQAAKLQITSGAADLDTLLGLTLVGARILPSLVPLEGLPRDRPDLALPYPLDAVLASGWKEAVELRLGELRLMGDFKAIWLSRHLDLSGRHQELLTLMALGVNKEALGEAIWPETAAKKVKNNFYVNLNALRKTLEPWGVGTYLDDVTLIRTHTDLWVLEAALEAGDHATVFNLYGGPLAPQLDLPPVAEARDALHSRVVDFLLAASSGEATPQTEAYLRRVVDLDPLNEPALRDLLRRLTRRGRRSEAARLYRSFARRLEDELGLGPDPSTTKLLEL